MRFKGTINEMGHFLMVPLYGVVLVMPVLLYFFVEVYESVELARLTMIKIEQMFVPILSLFWSFSLLTEPTGGIGNELLFIKKRSKLLRILVTLLIFLLLLIPYYIYSMVLAEYTLEIVVKEYLRVAIICLWLNGLLYMLSFLSGHAVTAVLCVGVYICISVFSDKKGTFLNYCEDTLTSNKLMAEKYSYYLAFAVMVWLLGYLLNRRYRRF